MRRTVRLATLPINGRKRDQIREVAHTYARVKDRFLLALAPASMWRHLASKQRFRDWAKTQGLYPDGVNVHLVDQAAFDAVETWVRHIESVIATSNLKAKIWRRFTGAQRHYAYSLLTNYADIGAILQGEAPERAKIQVDDAERASDREITLFTCHTEVKKILSERFQRRSESRTGGASVPLGTASDGVRARIAEGEATAHGRTPSRPRRSNQDMGGIVTDADSQSPVHTARTGETQRLESDKKRST